jgi:hypothetical protein
MKDGIEGDAENEPDFQGNSALAPESLPRRSRSTKTFARGQNEQLENKMSQIGEGKRQ